MYASTSIEFMSSQRPPPKARFIPRAMGQACAWRPERMTRVLLVDDDEFILEAAVEALSSRGFEVEAHSDPIEALGVVREDPSAIDVVLSDLDMPGMDGARLCAEIVELRADLPLILLTGTSLREAPEELGVRQILAKPMRVRDLVAAIESVLDDE